MNARAQKGVSLLLALVFVTLFGAALVSISAFNAYRVRENEARVTGREMVEIAKAARLYVRDRMITEPNLRTTAATPTRITLTTLKNAGYLSGNFGRTSGTDDLTALGQRVYVIMTNWPVGGNPADDNTVPTAFVLLRSSLKSSTQLMMEAVEIARQQDTSITAPLFNTSGVNTSADCRSSGAAAALWDTGCLTPAEFTTLMAAVPAGPATLEAGGLMIPAWKVVQPDLRAVMRFPQPENPGFATMLTDMHMGIPVDDCTNAATQVQITTTDSLGNAGPTASGLCDVETDTVADNKRFNISQVGNMALQRVITEPQNFDNIGTFATAETADIGSTDDDTMRITGDLSLGSDLRVYDQRALPGGVTHRFNVPNGTMVVERNAYMYSNDLANGGKATVGGAITQARGLVANTLTTTTFNSTTAGIGGDQPSIDVQTSTEITGDLQVAGDAAAELITETLHANFEVVDNGATPFNDARAGADMLTTDTTDPNSGGGFVQVTGIISANDGNIAVIGGTPVTNGGVNYSAIVGQISDGGDVQVDDTMTFSSTNSQISVDSTRTYDIPLDPTPRQTPITTISTVRCLADNAVANGCPYRQYTPPKVTP